MGGVRRRQIGAARIHACKSERTRGFVGCRPAAANAGVGSFMQSDIEIARAARLKPIAEIAAKIGAPESALHPFGRFIAKLEYDFLRSLGDRPDGKLILVTAINPTPAGRGQDDDDRRPRRCAQPHRQEDDHLPARALARAVLRPEGRRDGRRLRASCPDGRDQPPFHRRFSRHNDRPTISSRRWSTITCIGAMRSASTSGAIAWRRVLDMNDRALRETVIGLGVRQRVYARGRFRHHGRLGGDGGLLPCVRPRGSRGATRPDGGRLEPGPARGRRGRPQRGRRDDRAAQGRAQAQSRADPRRFARARAWRPVRQYRSRLQLGGRDPSGAQARRLRRHRSGLRRRSRRGEILRHQVPKGGIEAGGGGAGRDGQSAQNARRRRQGRARRGEHSGAGGRPRQSRPAYRQFAQVRRPGRGRGEPVWDRHCKPNSSSSRTPSPASSRSRRSSAIIGRAGAPVRKLSPMSPPLSRTRGKRSFGRSTPTT